MHILFDKYFSMLRSTNYSIDIDILSIASSQLPSNDFKKTINKPTGRFFYDPWILNEELHGTVWDEIYNSLPFDKGEARLIKLEPGNCYFSHADIDDRWHLNITSDRSYLVNLDRDIMHPVFADGKWYYMNAGFKHSAVNFGCYPRVQLVVRELLKSSILMSPIHITITLKDPVYNFRYLFDNSVSAWLNQMNKMLKINSFSMIENTIEFNLEETELNTLVALLPSCFELTVL